MKKSERAEPKLASRIPQRVCLEILERARNAERCQVMCLLAGELVENARAIDEPDDIPEIWSPAVQEAAVEPLPQNVKEKLDWPGAFVYRNE